MSASPVDPGANFAAVRQLPGSSLLTYLYNTDNDAAQDIQADFGFPDDIVQVGDWTGDGFDKPVSIRPHANGGLQWFGNNDLDAGDEFRFFFGLHGDTPLVGDFNGDSIDDVAVVRADSVPDEVVGLPVLNWYVSYGPFPETGSAPSNSFLPVDDVLVWGFEGDTPVVGDWNGDGMDQVGLVSQHPVVVNGLQLTRWYLPGSNGNETIDFGFPTDKPVVGDWDGDGKDNVGVVREQAGEVSRWLLDLDRDPSQEIDFRYGLSGDRYLVGRWADTPLISVNDVTVTEGSSGNKTATFTIRLDQASKAPIEVDIVTENGTATAANDYKAKAQTIRFEPGQLQQSFSVEIVGDSVVERDESFHVVLSDPLNGEISDGWGTGTIRNDDRAEISVHNVSRSEGNSGTTNFDFLIEMSAPVDIDVRLGVATRDGTALVSDNDYAPKSSTVLFGANGARDQTFRVAVVGDFEFESDEDFYVQLSGLIAGGRNVVLRDTQARGTILNDDDPPPLGGTIAGMKWNDLDGDGVRDLNETGIAGWTIYLDLDNDGTLDSNEPSTQTDSEGRYEFANLSPGAYRVGEVMQPGWEQTYPLSSGSAEGNKVSVTAALDSTAQAIPGEYIVKFRSGVNATRAAALRDDNNATLMKRINMFDMEVWHLNDPGLVNALLANDQVEYIEPNYLITAPRIEPQTTPDDPGFANLWGLHNTGQTGGTTDADIDAPEAWNLNTGSDILVGVIDTGIDYTHPDLQANIWTNPGEIPGNNLDDDGNGYVDDVHGYDFVNNDGNPFDDHGHGTHVSGTIAADGNNGVGVTGVSWTAKLMGLKFLDASGSGSTADAIRAVEYATMMDVDVTNNSWGGGAPSQALYDAIKMAGEHGQLFVASAGNSGRDTDAQPAYPASYDLPNIISVAATDHNDKLSFFSNYGASSVDLGAPGSAILSTVPGDRYAVFNGTSMAAPHVTGAISLIKSRDPNLTPDQIKRLLLETADPVSALQERTVSGGRLNVFNALNQIRQGGFHEVVLQSGQLLEGIDFGNRMLAPLASIAHAEGGFESGVARFTVGLDRDPVEPVTIEFATSIAEIDNPATPGEDFVQATGSITFNPGETRKEVTIALLNDNTNEQLESFALVLRRAVNADINAGREIATIADVDGGEVPSCDRLDVNCDGHISPIDALVVINALNEDPATTHNASHDVNQDGSISPIDALLVINELNRDVLPEAEAISPHSVAAINRTQRYVTELKQPSLPVASQDERLPYADACVSRSTMQSNSPRSEVVDLALADIAHEFSIDEDIVTLLAAG